MLQVKEDTNVRTAVKDTTTETNSVRNKMEGKKLDKIILFTTSRCPKCPEAKTYVEEAGLTEQVQVIVADQSKTGMELAGQYGISHVPVFVVENEEDETEDAKIYSLDEFKQLEL